MFSYFLSFLPTANPIKAKQKKIKEWLKQLDSDIPIEYDEKQANAAYNKKTETKTQTTLTEKIVFRPKLVESSSEQELKFILYHEVGHSRQKHEELVQLPIRLALVTFFFPHQTMDRAWCFLRRKPFDLPPFWKTFLTQRVLLSTVYGCLSYVAVNWYREFDADRFAYEHVGTEERIAALQFFKKEDKDYYLLSISHPSPAFRHFHLKHFSLFHSK